MINLEEIFMRKKEMKKMSGLLKTRCPLSAGHAVRLKQDTLSG